MVAAKLLYTVLSLGALVAAMPEPDRAQPDATSSTPAPAPTPTITFTEFYTKGDTSCSGPNVTKTYHLGTCHNLTHPAYSWYSYGPGAAGGYPQGQLYSGWSCKGASFTEHFDADGICFIPQYQNSNSKVARSFYLAAVQ